MKRGLWMLLALLMAPAYGLDLGFDNSTDLSYFEAFGVSTTNLDAGDLLLDDDDPDSVNHIGLLSLDAFDGDLDVILEYADHALPSTSYQANVSLLLAGDAYQWNTWVDLIQVYNKIHESMDYSWQWFEDMNGFARARVSSPRMTSGLLRLTRENGLVRAYRWIDGAWEPFGRFEEDGINYGDSLRVGIRMDAAYNRLYSARIKRLIVRSDSDGDGLLDEEEDLIGTDATLADSDADGLFDSEETLPLDGDSVEATAAELLGDDQMPIIWSVDDQGSLFITVENRSMDAAALSIPIAGLANGSTIELPLESASISAAADEISDTLGALARRTYKIDAEDFALLEVFPPDEPLVQPREASWVVDLSPYVFDPAGSGVPSWSLDSITGGGVTAVIDGESLTLTPTGAGCGLSTLNLQVSSSTGASATLELPVMTIGEIGSNLLTNPGFEGGTDSFGHPNDWAFYVWDGAADLTLDASPVEGSSAAMLQGLEIGKAAIFQSFNLPAGRYRLTGKVASWDLRSGQYNRTSLLHLAPHDQAAIEYNLVGGDNDWTEIDLVFTVDNSGEALVYFFIYGPGFFWVDDLELFSLEPCATDADGFALGGSPVETLDFVPEVTASDLVLEGYCDDPAFWTKPICQRLSLVNTASLVPTKASSDLVLIDYDPDYEIGETSGYLNVGTTTSLPTDWSQYDYLDIHLNNTGSTRVEGYVEIRDGQSTGYWSRVNWYTHFLPGEQVIRVPLSVFVGEKSLIKERRLLDTSDITALFVGVIGEGSVEIDSIQLSVEPPYEHDFDKLIKLDLGTSTSPVFPGFTALTEQSGYRPEYGYGLSSDVQITRSEDRRHPDDLLRDWVAIKSGGIDLDLPNGTYHVWMMLEDPGYWEYYQSYDYRAVHAEGQLAYEDSMDVDEFWSRFFANEEVEDLPGGDDIWQRYIKSRYVPVEFNVTVSDGQLNLEFETGNYFTFANTISALMIWPTSQQTQGEAFVDELWQRLNEKFSNEYAETIPDTPPYEVPNDFRNTGVLIFQRHWSEDVATDWYPEENKLVRHVRFNMSQGEIEPLTISLHALEERQLVHAQWYTFRDGLEITPYWVRYKLERATGDGTRFINEPKILEPLDLSQPMDLPVDRNRRLWFEIKASENADAGRSENGILVLTFDDGRFFWLLLTVKINPFELPEADMPYGYLGSVPSYPSSAYPVEVEAKQVADVGPALQMLRENGMTAFTGGMGGPEWWYDEQGQLQFDFTRYNAVMNEAEPLNFPYPPQTYGDLYPGGDLGFHYYRVYDTTDWYGKPHDQVVDEVLDGIRAHAASRGWPEPVYTVGDEPVVSELDHSNTLADAVYAAGSQSSVFTSATQSGQSKIGLADHVDYMFLTRHDSWSLNEVQNRGADCGLYNLGGRYARGIYQYKVHKQMGCTAGYFQFGFSSTHIDPYYALDGREDDIAAVLPTSEEGVLRRTVDLPRFREAIDDYRYLLALEDAIANPVQSSKVAAAQAWLDNLMAQIEIGTDALENPPFTDEELDTVREEACDHIEALLQRGWNSGWWIFW